MRIAVNASFRMHGGGAVRLRHLLGAWTNDEACFEHEFSVYVPPRILQRCRLPKHAASSFSGDSTVAGVLDEEVVLGASNCQPC